jgi:hypothetical protein
MYELESSVAPIFWAAPRLLTSTFHTLAPRSGRRAPRGGGR